jgi:hypothetical protein
MAVQNKTVTLLGASTKVTSITISPQPDGSYIVMVIGVATDGAGFSEPISTSLPFPAGTTVLDNMEATALSKLRIANGLEV